mgnify:CR=1 FL=1
MTSRNRIASKLIKWRTLIKWVLGLGEWKCENVHQFYKPTRTCRKFMIIDEWVAHTSSQVLPKFHPNRLHIDRLRVLGGEGMGLQNIQSRIFTRCIGHRKYLPILLAGGCLGGISQRAISIVNWPQGFLYPHFLYDAFFDNCHQGRWQSRPRRQAPFKMSVNQSGLYFSRRTPIVFVHRT